MPAEPTATDSVETYIAFEADSLGFSNESLLFLQDSLAIDTLQKTTTVEPPQPAGFEGIPRKETFVVQGSVTLLWLLQFFLLAFSVQGIVRQFGSIFKFDFSRQTIVFTGKEMLQAALLFVFSCLNISFLFYILFTGQQTLLWLDYLPIVAGFSIIFLLKMAVFHLLGFVFFNKNISSLWIQSNFAVHVLFNVLIFPVLVWSVISFRATSDVFLLYAAVIVAIICIGILFYRLLRIFAVQIYSFFHIILYLCTLEIMPLLLLYFVLKQMQIFN